jgi:hypothetical protein
MNVEYGYCQCGCGAETKISNWTDRRTGAVKGQPRRYLNGHSTKSPVSERFWQYVTKVDGCWEWSGTRHKQGYGMISNSDK